MNQTFIRTKELGTIWSSEKDYLKIESISLPLLQHEIIINLGDIFSVNESENCEKLLFSSINPSTIKTRVEGKYQALGILLSPTKIFHSFGLTLKEFNTEVQYNQDFLLFNKKHELLERLQNTNFSEKTKILSDFFLTNSKQKDYSKLVDELLIFITSNNFDNGVRINKIAKEINYTPKHLIAQFKDITGITPKKLFQINQVNFASRLMRENKNKSLTSIALECGFYDQSHFVRTFKKITHLTPSYFKKQQMKNGFSFPNSILK